jgi:hypothetical protein
MTVANPPESQEAADSWSTRPGGHSQADDLTGQRFGQLRVLSRLPNGSSRGTRWLTRCDCGRESTTLGRSLRAGVTSCGYHARPKGSGRPPTHGHTRAVWSGHASPTYQSWVHCWDRCTNPRTHNYRRYGGRGIRVCDRWRDFSLFLEDMGERPEGCTLDRIDRDGDYEPGNCRWANKQEQARDARYQKYPGWEKRVTAARLLREQGWRWDEIGNVVGANGATVRHWLRTR